MHSQLHTDHASELGIHNRKYTSVRAAFWRSSILKEHCSYIFHMWTAQGVTSIPIRVIALLSRMSRSNRCHGMHWTAFTRHGSSFWLARASWYYITVLIRPSWLWFSALETCVYAGSSWNIAAVQDASLRNDVSCRLGVCCFCFFLAFQKTPCMSYFVAHEACLTLVTRYATPRGSRAYPPCLTSNLLAIVALVTLRGFNKVNL